MSPAAATTTGANGAAVDLVLFVLAGGGAVGLFTLVRAYLAVRGSVETREAQAIANLEQWRRDADSRADAASGREQRCLDSLNRERDWGRYWQLRAARAERALIANGLEVPAQPARPAPSTE